MQARSQPGDDHRVLRIGLIEGQVLTLARPVHQQRLHAHRRQAPLRGHLIQHPPPVTRRLARHRHRHEPRRGRPGHSPAQQLAQLPRPGTHPPPGDHPRIVIRHDRGLLIIGQVDPHDRMIDGKQLPQPRQPGVAVPQAGSPRARGIWSCTSGTRWGWSPMGGTTLLFHTPTICADWQ